MAGIGSYRVLVTPEQLTAQANEVRRLGQNMRTHFNEIANTVTRSRGYWIGEGGDAHRRLYESQKENVNKMLARLMEHPDDLTQISANYKQAEKSNQARAQALPNNLL
ncbi:MAG: WXG100 family type VII secretion target [Lachnospiraceae bacterium]|nr:WXG100 family type VII secretion target [Lachnospiraceae bacterium]